MFVCGFPTVQMEFKAYVLRPYFQLLLLLLLIIIISAPITPDNMLLKEVL
jgi:hypothetical protein